MSRRTAPSRRKASSRRPWVARLYGWALWLLPPDQRRADGEEMLMLFEELWRDAPSISRRIRLVAGAFGRLPAAMPLAVLAHFRVRSAGFVRSWEPVREARLALRSLRRAPLFAVLSIFLIALGIGATTAVYTLIDHVLLRPLPYPEPDRLVFVQDGEWPDSSSHPGPVLQAFRELDSVEGWAFGDLVTANLTAADSRVEDDTVADSTVEGNTAPARVMAGVVSEDFFRVFGAQAALGRLFSHEERTSIDRVVLSHHTWTRRFGADPAMLGRTLRLEGEPVTVVGVLAPDFEPPRALVGRTVDIWRPIDWTQELLQRVDAENLMAVGRLSDDGTLTGLQAQLDAVQAAFAEQHPDRFTLDGRRAFVGVPLHEQGVRRARGDLHLLFGAVALLLLIAALNVAHLFLARGFSRRKEMDVRRALGAGDAILIRQLFTESLVIAAAGCAIGLLFATLALKSLQHWIRTGSQIGGAIDLPTSNPIVMDLPIFAFAVVVSVTTATLFGLLPALRSTRSSSQRAASSARRTTESRRVRGLRGALIVAEIAMALVIVSLAGLLLRSFLATQSNETGVNPAAVVALELRQPAAESIEVFLQQMEAARRELEAHPAIESAAFGLNLPFELTGGRRGGWSNRFEMVANGEPRPQILLRQMPVSAHYFEALGISLLGGRVWRETELWVRPPGADEARGDADRRPELPVVLSQNTAEHFFGDARDAVGQTLHHQADPGRVWRVLGVVADTRHWGLDQDPPHALYLPTRTMPHRRRALSMAVRFRGAPPPDPQSVLREAIWKVAPDVPVDQVTPLATWISDSTAGRRFDSLLFAAFAVTGLLLAAAGVYGSLLFSVQQQRRDMAIRLALGASARAVLRHVLGSGLRLALAGLALGGAFSFWGGRLLENRLYGIDAEDPVTLTSATVLILLAVLAASYPPAAQAARSDPQEILKAD